MSQVKYHQQVLFLDGDATVNATEKLFASHPWSGTDEEKQVKLNTWLSEMSGIENVKPPVFQLGGEEHLTAPGYIPETNLIYLPKVSIINLFWMWRLHKSYCKLGPKASPGAIKNELEDVTGWSASLFFKLRPKLFVKAVREGKIGFMKPNDVKDEAQ